MVHSESWSYCFVSVSVSVLRVRVGVDVMIGICGFKGFNSEFQFIRVYDRGKGFAFSVRGRVR